MDDDSLARALGIDLGDPEVRRAIALTEADLTLLEDLRQVRKDRNLSQTALADLMGVTQPAVSAFERKESDPRLSTVRRYAQAVGALVAHVVVKDEGQAMTTFAWFSTSMTTHVSTKSDANVSTAPRRLSASLGLAA